MATGVAPDRRLVERMAQGDREAEWELRRRYDGSLYALAYGLVLDSEAADAIVAETFELVSSQAGRFDPTRCSVHGWLTGVTKRRARWVLEAPLPGRPEQIDAVLSGRHFELEKLEVPLAGGPRGRDVELPGLAGALDGDGQFGVT